MNVQVHAGPVTIPAAQLATFVARLFVATGLSAPAAEKVANGLVEADLEGLASHGVMLADMELMGLPHRVVIGDRSLKEGQVEYQGRHDREATRVAVADCAAFVAERLALVGRQVNRNRGEPRVEVFEPAWADQRGGHRWVTEDPGEGQRTGVDTAVGRGGA